MFRTKSVPALVASALAGLAVIGAGDLVRAEPAASAAAMAGTWEIGDDLSASRCTVTLSAADTAEGYEIDLGQSCPALFPILARVKSWRPDHDGGIHLVAGDNHVVVSYAVSETDALLSVEPQNIILTMTPLDRPIDIVGSIGTHDARR